LPILQNFPKKIKETGKRRERFRLPYANGKRKIRTKTQKEEKQEK